jgi:LacI family transcriptional regulator
VQGYRSAIGGRGQVLWGDLTPDWGAAAAGQLDADGLVCGNDLVALGALHGLAARGLRVPGDVMVVGCDDIGIARHTIPSLTSVAVPSLDLGRRGVALLLDLIQRRPAPKRGVVLPVDLRVRGSTEPRESVEPRDGPGSSHSTEAGVLAEPGAPTDITAPPVPARG